LNPYDFFRVFAWERRTVTGGRVPTSKSECYFKEVSPIFTVSIDRDKCEGCGECTESCPADILEMVDGKAEVTGNADECLGCETCVSVCPSGAVTVQES